MAGHHRIAVIGLSVILATLTLAAAQPPAAPSAPAPPPLIAASPTTGPTTRPAFSAHSRAMVADALAQMVSRLRSPNALSDASHMHCQAVLLDYALQVNDADPELWHLRAELARQVNDSAGQEKALTHYLKLRPDDDAVQWLILVARVNQFQTVDRRVAAMEAVLANPSAQAFSPALRSRIASYAAEGWRELGDTPRCIQRARQAADLDPSNTSAQQLLYELTAARGASIQELGAAIIALLKAEPLSPAPRRMLGDLLLSNTHYRRAAQQYQVAQQLLGQPADSSFYFNWCLSLAASGKSDTALDILNEFATVLSGPAPTTAPAGPPATQAAAPAALPLELDALRTMILRSTGSADRPAGALSTIENRIQSRIKSGDLQAEADLAWIELWLSSRPPQADALQRLVQQRGAKDPIVQRLTAWTQLIQGQEQGRGAMATLAKTDPFALYGMAQWAKNDAAQRTALLRQTVATAPGTLAALRALWDLQAMKLEPTPSSDSTLLARSYDQLMPALRDLDLARSPWVNLSVKVADQPYQFLQPLTATVRIKNVSSVPLTLGSDGVLNTRLLLTQTVMDQGKAVRKFSTVADLARRLRLEPRQALELEVRLDRDDWGFLLWSLPHQAATFSLVGTLDPRLGPGGSLAKGPLGATDSIYSIQRPAFVVGPQGPDGWLAALHGSDEVSRLEAIALMATIGPALLTSPEEKVHPLGRNLIENLNNEFAAMDPWEQVWTLRFIPSAPAIEAQFTKVMQTAQTSDRPMVRNAYLTLHVSEPDAPALKDALRASTAEVADFARALQAVLTSDKAPSPPSASSSPSAPPMLSAPVTP